MLEKLSINEFRNIKKQLLVVKTDGLDEETNFIRYISLQDKLLSYDLSGIPFEEWLNYEIVADEKHIADFSKTKANIDLCKVYWLWQF